MAARRHAPRRPSRPIPWRLRFRRWQEQLTAWSKAHALAILIILLGLLIVLYLFLWVGFILPQYHLSAIECPGSPIAISLRYPKYVSVGDESFIELGLLNTDTRPISGTAVIAFSGNLSVHPLQATSNALPFAALPPGGLTVDRVQFSLNEPPTRVRGSVPFAVQLSGDSSCRVELTTAPVWVAPVPGLKTGLAAILSGTLSIATLTGLLWEQIRMRFFPKRED